MLRLQWGLRRISHILGLHYQPDHIQTTCWCEDFQSKADEINEKLWKEWK